MEILSCKYLINCIGRNVTVEKALKHKPVVVFFFGASWCEQTPCLLPKLIKLHSEMKTRKAEIEIIYVSFDTDEAVMMKDFIEKHHGWYTIPFGDHAIRELQIMYNVTFIPQLIVVSKNGSIITRKGRADLEQLGNDVLIKWCRASLT